MKGVILDPTIRIERDSLQALEVDKEKKSIYEPCIPFLSIHYNIPTSNWSTFGVLFGARGSLPSVSARLLKSYNITNYDLNKILLQVLKDSLQILQFHLYATN